MLELTAKQGTVFLLRLIKLTQERYKEIRKLIEDAQEKGEAIKDLDTKRAMFLGFHMHKLMWYLINLVYDYTNWTIVLDRTPVSGILGMIQRVEGNTEIVLEGLRDLASEVGGIPLPEEMRYLHCFPNTSYQRLTEKGEVVERGDLKREHGCFTKFIENVNRSYNDQSDKSPDFYFLPFSLLDLDNK